MKSSQKNKAINRFQVDALEPQLSIAGPPRANMKGEQTGASKPGTCIRAAPSNHQATSLNRLRMLSSLSGSLRIVGRDECHRYVPCMYFCAYCIVRLGVRCNSKAYTSAVPPEALSDRSTIAWLNASVEVSGVSRFSQLKFLTPTEPSEEKN